ncbi:MAG: ABC transporter permease subunit [Ruminococcus sp.]|nr:ABC transporter permease subunit [Ruminococcus sp.]
MGAIYRREMGAFFTSGLGYVFLTVFYAFSGYFFYTDVLSSKMTDTSPMFVSMFIIFIFLIPVLTMRLLSEEKKNKTDQGLLTAPISLWELVLGKFLAAFTLFVIAESIIFVYAIILKYLGDVVWQTLIGNYVAMLFLGAAFISIGLFVSSLTENQMTAAVVSFVVMLILYVYDDMFLGRISNDKILDVLSALSFRSRYVEFTTGVFSAGSILFFISTAFLFNFFTIKVLEKKRWS